MKRYLPFAASALALAAVAAAPAFAGYGSNEEHEYELIAMDQDSCAAMIQAFDASGATSAEAVSLRNEGEKNCAEMSSSSTSVGVETLEKALEMAGIKVVRETPKPTTGQFIE